MMAACGPPVAVVLILMFLHSVPPYIPVKSDCCCHGDANERLVPSASGMHREREREKRKDTIFFINVRSWHIIKEQVEE